MSCDVTIASNEVVRRCLNRMALRQAESDGAPPSVALSDRELMVLRGLAMGMTQAQIADSARLSIRTVKRVLAGLADKLDAPSPFGLGARARTLGLVPA